MQNTGYIVDQRSRHTLMQESYCVQGHVSALLLGVDAKASVNS